MRGEFVDVGGVRLYYYAAGSGGAGEPIIFLHGFPTSSHIWRDVVPLVPAGHRVVVVDLLGYGRSDRPEGRDLSIKAHAERVLALLDVLCISYATIIGHDLGGGIAQYLAVRHPTRVARLGLVSSVAFDSWPT
ncbi:MAG: alpha/beta fold hydrolase, partial [Gemmatimonadota bacterium]|nr:alpha/beta fold hydrolase [Gemmatimonadota bacterium]